MNEILQYLRDKQDEMVECLRTLVELESPSLDKELTDRVGTEIARLFVRLTGGTVTSLPNEKLGDSLRGEWGNRASDTSPQVLMLAHFDTVWRAGDLRKMPFRIEDGRAYGPGSFDMKGGLVQGLYALHALTELGRVPSCRVVFLFTSDEEIGSPTSREMIEQEAARSRCVLVLEPAMQPNGALKTARKAVGHFHLHVTGRPAHAGVEPEKGRSAIEEMARQIIYLHSLTNHEKGTTVNVGVVRGGTTSNVVAAEAEAHIDLRVRTAAEAERMLPLILGLQPETPDTTLKVTGGVNRPPLERTEQVVRMYELARRLAREELDFDLPEAATGGASDGSFTAPLAPTIDGLGAVGDGAHAVYEHVIISDMPLRGALTALLVEELGGEG